MRMQIRTKFIGILIIAAVVPLVLAIVFIAMYTWGMDLHRILRRPPGGAGSGDECGADAGVAAGGIRIGRAELRFDLFDEGFLAAEPLADLLRTLRGLRGSAASGGDADRD